MGNGSGDLQVTSGCHGRVAGVRSMQPSRTRGLNNRRPVKQSAEAVRRTVYICDLDQQVCHRQTWIIPHGLKQACSHLQQRHILHRQKIVRQTCWPCR